MSLLFDSKRQLGNISKARRPEWGQRLVKRRPEEQESHRRRSRAGQLASSLLKRLSSARKEVGGRFRLIQEAGLVASTVTL